VDEGFKSARLVSQSLKVLARFAQPYAFENDFAHFESFADKVVKWNSLGHDVSPRLLRL
jgi:hypothetical protein